jgi:hypothetical protein
MQSIPAVGWFATGADTREPPFVRFRGHRRIATARDAAPIVFGTLRADIFFRSISPVIVAVFVYERPVFVMFGEYLSRVKLGV